MKKEQPKLVEINGTYMANKAYVDMRKREAKVDNRTAHIQDICKGDTHNRTLKHQIFS